jgi:hypothetical protein
VTEASRPRAVGPPGPGVKAAGEGLIAGSRPPTLPGLFCRECASTVPSGRWPAGPPAAGRLVPFAGPGRGRWPGGDEVEADGLGEGTCSEGELLGVGNGEPVGEGDGEPVGDGDGEPVGDGDRLGDGDPVADGDGDPLGDGDRTEGPGDAVGGGDGLAALAIAGALPRSARTAPAATAQPPASTRALGGTARDRRGVTRQAVEGATGIRRGTARDGSGHFRRAAARRPRSPARRPGLDAVTAGAKGASRVRAAALRTRQDQRQSGQPAVNWQ